MTGQLIFKMELFKFLKDKSYLITTGILAVLNIAVTLYFLNMLNGFETYYKYGGNFDFDETVFASMLVLAMMAFLGNWIFIFIYPFHILSSDYKNNVMAMMIASGVNRRKLFFAKIGAVACCTLIVTVVLTLIPAILFLAKLNQYAAFKEFFEAFFSAFDLLDMSLFQIILFGLVSYLSTVVLVAASCILLKGSNLTFVVFIGFNLLISLANTLLLGVADTFNMNFNGYVYFQIFLYALYTVLFGFISLRALQKQNL